MSNGSDHRSASTASSLIRRVQARDPDAADVFQDVFITLHRAVKQISEVTASEGGSSAP